MKYLRLDRRDRALKVIEILRRATIGMVEPAISLVIKQYGRKPFLILVSCLLSLRTKDSVSFLASQRLFEYAQTPNDLIKLSVEKIEKLIYPVGFYRRKARNLHSVSTDLIRRFSGRVPSTEQDLLSIKGVGRKTANLVLGEAFGIPAICVDTHVHRISNRLGLVISKTPQETEEQLKQILPKKYWIEFNRLLVMWGQNARMPVVPQCSTCTIALLCSCIDVKKRRS